MTLPYLFRLGSRLANGLESLDPERKRRHRGFLVASQAENGGFTGRDGESDLYYTGFALRALAVLGGLEPEENERVGAFLRRSAQRNVSVVDLLSWLYSALVVQASGGPDILGDADQAWPERMAETLERFRTTDGGYAKGARGAMGSTYHSFLVALCYELIGLPIPNPADLVRFVYDRQRDDGGFVEIAAMKRSGTNPTAAAVALLDLLGATDDAVGDNVSEFLAQVAGDEGGFQANTRIPFADGLSTFTGLLTARDLGLNGILDAERVERFVASLEEESGGFRGAAWDVQPDVEYTFYGLGILALLNQNGAG